MAVQVGAPFQLKSKQFLDVRQSFNDIAAMTSFSAKSLPDGFIAYVKTEDKYYKFNSTNDFDTQLGYWREYNGGGDSSSTDEKVKLNNTSESKYLEELIDNSTIEVDIENGVVKAVSLDGLETTVATLNFVKNLDKDIMSYLSSIGNPMAFKGVVADDDALSAITDMVSGDTYIVQSSASNSDKTMTFIYNGVEFVPMAETSIEVRDFTVDPIDLSTETTGTLPKEKIDTGIARVSATLDKSTYKGSADGVVKQADKLTGLTATTSQLSDAVTNTHKHTNKTVLDKILSNGIGNRVWTDAGTYRELIIKDTVQPTDEYALWLDITDSTNPILKIFDGNDWVEVSDSSSSSGTGTSVTVDTAMSDTSTNPVQNKVIKDYVDSKAVEVSSTSGNAIETKTDGVYVKKTAVSTDSDNALSEKSNGLYVKDLSGELDKINYAQKTVNEELDYICLRSPLASTTLATNTVLPFNIVAGGNMETDSDNCSVKLKANKTYRISCDFLLDGSGYCYITLYDITNATVLAGFGKTASNYNTTNSDSSLDYVYTPTSDCEVQIKLATKTGTCHLFNTYYDCAYFIVQEIGRAVTIDPLEYVNESEGIEDTPVGHIMACMSNSAPKHYLICDGTEYNIVDYPYLAEHFKTEFGSYDYFGGDGVTTFAVPDLRAEYLRGAGAASRKTGYGADVGVHQDPTRSLNFYKGYDSSGNNFLAIYGNAEISDSLSVVKGINADTFIPYTSSTSKAGLRIDIDKIYDTDVSSYEHTSRPTSTSVLYCIKYEPCYYMQNTYNGNVYSTEEKVVGKWVNGKLIYQKTFTNCGNLPSSTNMTISHEINDIDMIVSVYGIAENSSQTIPLPYPHPDATVLLDVRVDKILVATTSSNFTTMEIKYITMQYTKTTDSPSDTTVVPSSGSCDCITYTDEEVTTEIDAVLEG